MVESLQRPIEGVLGIVLKTMCEAIERFDHPSPQWTVDQIGATQNPSRLQFDCLFYERKVPWSNLELHSQVYKIYFLTRKDSMLSIWDGLFVSLAASSLVSCTLVHSECQGFA